MPGDFGRCIRMTVPPPRAAPARRTALAEGALEAALSASPGESMSDVLDRYALLSDLSPDTIVVHQQGIIRYGNAASCRLMGVAAADVLVGRPVRDFVHPDDLAPMLERLAALVATGQITPATEMRLVRPDGEIRWVQSVSVRTTWLGQPAFQAVLRDLQDQKAAEAALRYQAALVAHASDAIIATDNDGIVTSWNPAAEQIYGWASHEAVGRCVIEVTGASPELGERIEAQHRRSDGGSFDARLSVAELRDDEDGVIGRVVVCSDITAEKAADFRHAAVIASLQEGVFVLAADGTVQTINPAGDRILGARAADIIASPAGTTGAIRSDGTRIEPGTGPLSLARQTGVAQEDVVIGIPRGDHTLWLLCGCRPLETSGEPPYPIVVSFTDISERRAAEAALLYQANHDSLTGLESRGVVTEHIRAFLHSPQHTDSMLTVVFLDLDNFKVVNDSLGHGVGDRILRIVAGRLRGAVDAGDIVGSIGGDGFLVVGRRQRGVDEAVAFADRMRASISAPMSVAGRSLTVDASAGVVVVHASAATTAEAILRDADVAMYQAKDAGRGRQQIFDSVLRDRALRRLQLEEDLRSALESDELHVAYQPLIDLTTGRAVATEALLRWTHPEFGSVSPVEFIRVAEESGLIVRVGARVLEMACAQTALWRAQHPALCGLRVAVNVSARQLTDPMLVATVTGILDSTGLPADALWLEITESMLMDDAEGAIRVLRALRDLGVHLSIDDFGTGYSSLAYLRRFPVEELKIDRSFVIAMAGSDDDTAIVASVTALAHTLGLTVVAEGIETVAQLDSIRALGIDQAQGYLFSRPAAAADVVDALLRRHL
ncbi:MAG: gmr [Frankiales bacterium]|nr:gmr [Frankiales bacterium]